MAPSEPPDSYTLRLAIPDVDVLEDFERVGKNVVQVSVLLPDGRQVASPDAIVTLALTEEAMLGLGTYLIRYAHGRMRGRSPVVELEPAEPRNAVTQMGICLHPTSCRLVLFSEEFRGIHELTGASE